MVEGRFAYFDAGQVALLRDRVHALLADQGVKLDEHREMLEALAAAGAQVDRATCLVRFPPSVLTGLLAQVPSRFRLGSRGGRFDLELPRADGAFHTRTCTGGHGWLDPADGGHRPVGLQDLADWAKLAGQLADIDFLSFLFCSDAPCATADLHALKVILTNSQKHAWLQPYSAATVAPMIEMGALVAGGAEALRKNPPISLIACSLTPRTFKYMDLEIIARGARAGVPIQACALPGAGGTAPATLPGVVILAAAEIVAMAAMAQAVAPGTPVIACPIVFATDMRTGRSLQSSVEAMRAASASAQLLKAAWGFATHNYGSGCDSPCLDAQAMSERAMLTTLTALAGLDILGGAGQLEVATTVSPLQLIVDDEVLGMARRLLAKVELSEDQMAWQLLQETPAGQQFLTSQHTMRHCRDGLPPKNFNRQARESWQRAGGKDLLARVRERYLGLMATANDQLLPAGEAGELDRIVAAAEAGLAG